MRLRRSVLGTLFAFSQMAYANSPSPAYDRCQDRGINSGHECYDSSPQAPDGGLNKRQPDGRYYVEGVCAYCPIPNGRVDKEKICCVGANNEVLEQDVSGGCSMSQGRNAFGSIALALGFAALVLRKKRQ